MALHSYLTVGRSGLRVSPFCLGTMTFGEDYGWGSSVEASLNGVSGPPSPMTPASDKDRW